MDGLARSGRQSPCSNHRMRNVASVRMPSLKDGVERWVKHHVGTAKKHPRYVGELNAGDCVAGRGEVEACSVLHGRGSRLRPWHVCEKSSDRQVARGVNGLPCLFELCEHGGDRGIL